MIYSIQYLKFYDDKGVFCSISEQFFILFSPTEQKIDIVDN